MLPSLHKDRKEHGEANRLGGSTILTTDPSTPITLDSVAQLLRNGSVKRALSALDDLLNCQKNDADRWPQFKQLCAAHQLRELLQQDPLTFRAFTKPRGYAGDAVMMDFVYGLGQAVEAESHATRLGRAIFRFTWERPASRAVRYRRKLIADLIDGTAAKGAARILAIASGHLREVELSRAVREKRLEEFVAFDQDAASLEVVSREYAQLGVTAMQGSARQILSGKAKLGSFDFVYAAGLFDYLTHPAARSLTAGMFAMLRPGGRLLVPNFLPGVRDIGYMEAFMDWHLIYRDHGMLRALAESLPAREIADCKLFNNSDDAIAFLLISKAK